MSVYVLLIPHLFWYLIIDTIYLLEIKKSGGGQSCPSPAGSPTAFLLVIELSQLFGGNWKWRKTYLLNPWKSSMNSDISAELRIPNWKGGHAMTPMYTDTGSQPAVVPFEELKSLFGSQIQRSKITATGLWAMEWEEFAAWINKLRSAISLNRNEWGVVLWRNGCLSISILLDLRTNNIFYGTCFKKWESYRELMKKAYQNRHTPYERRIYCRFNIAHIGGH
jgi:hypothetical protein